MTTMQTAVLVGHTIIALLIIVLVLLQKGKGADAGAAFGAGASGTVFGARGSSNFFSRATAILATVFFVSSLGLAYMSSQRAESVDSLLENAQPLEEAAEAVDDMPAVDDALPDMIDEAVEAGEEAAGELPDLAPESDADPEAPSETPDE